MSRARHTSSLGRRRALGVAVVAIGALAIVLAYTRPNPFRHEQQVRVMFTDAGGIGVVGADVRVHGVRVGRITARERVGDHALLTLELRRDIGAVHRDARAQLRPRTPFEGTAYVDLDPGSPGSPKLGDATLGLARTRNYVPLDQALRFARPSTRQAVRDDVRALHGMFAAGGTAGVSRLLRIAPPFTREASIAGRAIRGPGGEDLRGAVNELAGTLHTVADGRDDLAAIVREGGPTFAALNTDAARPLDRTLAILPARLADLERGGTALQAIVQRLDALSGDLRPGVRDLAATLRRTRPVLRSAEPTLARTPRLLDTLRGAVRAAAAASRPTRSLLRAVEPVSSLLSGSLLPALHRPTSLGIPAYLQFINLFQGGGGAFRPFQTPAQGSAPLQSGAGHFVRFSARFFTGVGYPLPPCSAFEKASPELAAAFAENGVCQ